MEGSGLRRLALAGAHDGDNVHGRDNRFIKQRGNALRERSEGVDEEAAPAHGAHRNICPSQEFLRLCVHFRAGVALEGNHNILREVNASEVKRKHVGVGELAIGDGLEKTADTAGEHRQAEQDANHAVAARGAGR